MLRCRGRGWQDPSDNESDIGHTVGLIAGLSICKKTVVALIGRIVQDEPKKISTGFCYKFVKSPPNLIIFGTRMAKKIELCEVHSFSTLPNFCQCTTV